MMSSGDITNQATFPIEAVLLSLVRSQSDSLDIQDKMMKYYELINRKNIISAAAGATAIYLVSKTLLAMYRSPPFNPESSILVDGSFDSQGPGGFPGENGPLSASRVNGPGELRWLLQSLASNIDDNSKRTTLHKITQCIYLRESEAGTCTNDDIKLVALFLDDSDLSVKTEALNALKAFTIALKFKIKIQEYVSKIVELVTSNWDNNLQVAGLKLLNGLNVPDHTHALLRRLLPNFMEIVLMSNNLVKVQVLKFLSTLAQKEDLLYDIMNCKASSEFLNLFQASLPGNLLYEILVFVERLSEGRLTPQYQSMQWQYSDNSLHEIIFGDNSRLSDRLLALVVHPEEEVQAQACKVILSLRLNREESRTSGAASMGSNIPCPLESTRISQANQSSVSSRPISPTPLSSGAIVNDTSFDSSYSTTDEGFQPLQPTDGTFQTLPGINDSFQTSENPGSPMFLQPSDRFLPPESDCSDENVNSA